MAPPACRRSRTRRPGGRFRPPGPRACGPARWSRLRDHAQPGRARVAPTPCIAAQVGRTAEAGEPPLRDGRGVSRGVHLQSESDEQVARVLAGELRQHAVRPQGAVVPGEEHVRASADVVAHPDLAAEADDALDPAALDRRDERGMRIRTRAITRSSCGCVPVIHAVTPARPSKSKEAPRRSGPRDCCLPCAGSAPRALIAMLLACLFVRRGNELGETRPVRLVWNV